MSKVRSHKDLEIWKLSMDFVVQIYKITEQLPAEERYGLTVQIRRAVVSIPSNIAEGAGRNTPKEFIRFLYISLGSLAEVETQLEICNRLGYLSNNDNFLNNSKKIRIMIANLIKALKLKIT